MFADMISSFLRELARDFANHDWSMITLDVILILLVASLVALALWGLYIAIDSWFRPLKQGIGIIVGKAFTPQHTTTSTILIGSISIPQVHVIPDDWSLTIEYNGERDSIPVSPEFYASMKEGRTVPIGFVRGRLSRNFYMREVSEP